MSRILIVYASKHGQTEKIARFISDKISERGFSVDLYSVESEDLPSNIDFYDMILVGAPVYVGKYPRPLQRWACRQVNMLNLKPSAFFSVCLGILQNDEKVKQEEEQIIERFLAKVRWKPAMKVIFAGALNYTQYNWIFRLIMKSIAKKAGGSTDTRQDVEYTDWNKVTSFVDLSLGQLNFKTCPLIKNTFNSHDTSP